VESFSSISVIATAQSDLNSLRFYLVVRPATAMKIRYVAELLNPRLGSLQPLSLLCKYAIARHFFQLFITERCLHLFVLTDSRYVT